MTRRKRRGNWKIYFEIKEALTDAEDDPCALQQAITRIIARAIGSIPPQLEGLKIVDYHIYFECKEQPEAECLKLVKK